MPRSKLHPLTIRFDPQGWVLVRTEARRIGVPVAQYIREAAVARAVVASSRRPDTPCAVFEEVLRMAEVRGIPHNNDDVAH